MSFLKGSTVNLLFSLAIYFKILNHMLKSSAQIKIFEFYLGVSKAKPDITKMFRMCIVRKLMAAKISRVVLLWNERICFLLEEEVHFL